MGSRLEPRDGTTTEDAGSGAPGLATPGRTFSEVSFSNTASLTPVPRRDAYLEPSDRPLMSERVSGHRGGGRRSASGREQLRGRDSGAAGVPAGSAAAGRRPWARTDSSGARPSHRPARRPGKNLSNRTSPGNPSVPAPLLKSTQRQLNFCTESGGRES